MKLGLIHHFGLVVEDIQTSIAWYQDVLGFRLEHQIVIPDVGLKIAHIISDTGVRLELFEQNNSVAGPDETKDVWGSLKTRGAKHIGMIVDNAEAAAKELEQKGVEIVHPPAIVEFAKVKNFFIRDNSGNIIEFNELLSR
jgi:catechol 2,3-dioxygenase-like lactoylglutathione lyase family enzyme